MCVCVCVCVTWCVTCAYVYVCVCVTWCVACACMSVCEACACVCVCDLVRGVRMCVCACVCIYLTWCVACAYMLRCALAFQDSDEDSFGDKESSSEEEQSIGGFDAEFFRMMGGSNICTTSDNPTKFVSSRMQDKMDSERKVRPSSI